VPASNARNWEVELGSSEGVRVEDVPSSETWKRLQEDAGAILIDVRTKAEWAFVGLADLSSLDKEVAMIEWQEFPGNRIDPAFASRVLEYLGNAGADKSTQLLFICRSGGRSRMAAEAVAALGYTRSHNVADGFEGRLDTNRHRGTIDGWKVAGLPWVQG